MEWLGTITLISIFVATWVAIYGIDAWRREHVGKRQLELAEDTLALFYEASDAIKHMRHPVSYSHETEEIERGETESDAKYKARKNASVVFRRYNQYQEIFNKIHASRYRFMAQIGKKQAEPFDDLKGIVNEIKTSARKLARLWAREHFQTDNQWKKHQAQTDKHEAVLWDGFEESDPINQKIDVVISEIEKICQAIISGKGTLHGFLNKKIGKNR